MPIAAHTPEELDALLEDAFVLRDEQALADLFEPRAALGLPGERIEAHGDEVPAAIADLWERKVSYVAEPRAVLRAGSIALVVGDHAITVMRRGADDRWRYSIALLTHDTKGMHP